MKTLYARMQDPSGYQRYLKWTEAPITLPFLDPELSESGIEIHLHTSGRWWIKSLHPDVFIEVSDLKFQSLEIPFFVPIQIKGTELIFRETSEKETTVSFPEGCKPWVTQSESGARCLTQVRRSAPSRLSIYLCGETGTGKEVLAKLIHGWSVRAGRPFIPINCGALPISLAESELFGHVKGSFTGAVKDRPGALLQAHGGTLFLDEVGDLPLEIQVKLLRFLESGEIRPVGSDRLFHADVRVVCATHKPLKALVSEGRFRRDLYFRLASVPIEIPNLRSRPDDIQLLSQVFATELGKSLSPEAQMKLQSFSWPGNVRELRHAIERASGLAGPFQSLLTANDFSFIELSSAGAEEPDVHLPGVTSLKEMERIMILRALKIAKGNRNEAAKILGVARSTLFEMIKRYRISGPRSHDFWTHHLTTERS